MIGKFSYFTREEQRILLTNDRSDFGKLVFLDHLPDSGIILFRLKSREADLLFKQARLKQVLATSANRLQHFIVVTNERIKIREAKKAQAA